jgi:hypothetical protein
MTELFGKLWAPIEAGMMSKIWLFPTRKILIELFKPTFYEVEASKSFVLLASPTGFEPVLPP